MKRRRFVQSLISAPAATALVAQQQPSQTHQIDPTPKPAQPAPGIPLNPTQAVQPPRSASMELPKLDASIPDVGASTVPGFFNQTELDTLRKLTTMLVPAREGKPGATDVQAAEFLDFLIGESPQERQHIYRAGLDGLNKQASKHFSKPFAELDAQQAGTLLAPLQQPWTYDVPDDPIARFLREAKQDVRTATVNSREYYTAMRASAVGRRGFAGGGLYWYPLG